MIYINDMRRTATVRRGGRTVTAQWSHLLAGTPGELQAFAARLGLHPSWLQRPGTRYEHYDLTETRRQVAVAAGATQITYRENGLLVAAKATGIGFDLHRLRAEPHAWNAELRAAQELLDTHPRAARR